MLKKTYPGKLIVIEGLDGCGKSTQIELVAEYLREKNHKVLLTSQPAMHLSSAAEIKKFLVGELQLTPIEKQKLFIQNRKEHLEQEVIPALNDGYHVVCGRYVFSTLAYGHCDGIDVDVLLDLNKEFLFPDMVVLLDISVDESLRRIEARGGVRQPFEKREKLQKVNEVYQKLPSMFETITVINGEQPIDVIAQKIRSLFEQ